MARDEHLQSLSTAAWDDLQAVVEQFESTWDSGRASAIEAYLPADPDRRLAVLVELIYVDLELRFKARLPVRVEEYLARFPELEETPHLLLNVIVAEYQHRLNHGETPLPDEYFQRFPGYQQQLVDRLASTVLETNITPVLSAIKEGDSLARVGRYRIEGEIARGGMGRVLRVYDEDFQRLLAMKVLLSPGHPDLEERFLREARLTGQLQHPGVPAVQEMGRLANGQPFFLMKLVQGQSLAGLLKHRTSPSEDLPRFLHVFEQVCQTVAYAHSQSVIHRDLKPSNIMVGAFGEVQVMDWGLAKQLGGEVVRWWGGEKPSVTTSPPHHLTTSPPEYTAAGSVLGTPAYMAPEQARGEIDRLDARCDVFGLGAMLCELLTGQPPFTASADENLCLAKRGDLSDAGARLDRCGADAELVQLAKHCLAPEAKDRPAAAGALAAAVLQYQAAVQQRLHQAEIDRAAAQARAEEEQKRRTVEQAKVQEERKRREAELAKVAEERKRWRVQRYLAAAVVLFLLVGGAGGARLWALHTGRLERQVFVQKEVTTALQAATNQRQALHAALMDPHQVHEFLSNLDRWQAKLNAAQAAWQQAQSLAKSDEELLEPEVLAELAVLDQQLQADRSDWERATALDEIQLAASSLVDGKFNPAATVPRYERVFQTGGLDVRNAAVAAVAAKIRHSPIRLAWLAALDHWAAVLLQPTQTSAEVRKRFRRREPATRNRPQATKAAVAARNFASRLLAIARQVDPDPLRDRFRDPSAWDNPRVVQELAGKLLADKTALKRLSPQMLALVGQVLSASGGQAAIWLRQAQLRHPTDFWLNFNLGNTLALTKPAEAAGYYRAALAVRPRSVVAWGNLGAAVADQKDLPGAVAAYQKALDIDRHSGHVWTNLGIVLRKQKDSRGAMAAFQQALVLDPKDRTAWISLGAVRLDRKELPGALAAYQKALALDPHYANTWIGVGSVRYEQNDFRGAAEACRKALAIDPHSAAAWNNLGIDLCALKDFAKAVDAHQKALAIDPQSALGWNNLGLAQWERKDPKRAIAAYRKAIVLDPQYTLAWNNLGIALAELNDLEGAVDAYQEALATDPYSVLAWTNLGTALHAQKDLPGAVAAHQQALAIDPQSAQTWINLGNALRSQKSDQEAVDAYHQALQIDAQSIQAWTNLSAALIGQKKYQEAAAACNKALAIDPRSALAWNNLATALSHRQDLPGAAAAYQKALAIDPQAAETWANFGGTLGNLGKYREAENACNKALAIDPRSGLAWTNLGTVLRAQQDLPGAAAAYQKALAIDPRSALAWTNFGTVLRAQQNLKGAVDAHKKALACDPHNVPAWINLGVALTDQKDHRGAADAYKKARDLAPETPNAWLGLGMALQDLGNFTEAADCFRHTLKLVPRPHPFYALGQERLQQCQQLLALEQRLPLALQGGKVAPAERLMLASFCEQYKQRYRDAARLYAAAFADQPALAADVDRGRRYRAACAATLAAAGAGTDQLPDRDRADLRRQALDWLRADLKQFTQVVAAGQGNSPKPVSPLEKLSQPTRSPAPADLLRTHDRLGLWQANPALASVREEKALIQLAAAEQQSWRQLWAEVQALRQQISACFRETGRWEGTLTGQQKEQVHEVQLQAGKTYVLDLQGKGLAPFLRLEDVQAKNLNVTNVPPQGAVQEVRCLFIARQGGTYRLIATAVPPQGTGAYTLILREVQTFKALQ